MNQLPISPDRDLLQRAICAYARYCKANGLVFQQPTADATLLRSDGVVMLSNVRGELARYRVDAHGRLRRLSYTG